MNIMKKMINVAANTVRKAGEFVSRNAKIIVGAISTAAVAVASQAQSGTDATVITTSASSAFVGVAGLCISVGTFFVVYRLVKRVK